MSIFDQILGQISSNVDVKNLATKLGIDASTVETAIAGLAAGHAAPTDTVQTAAENTGIDSGILQQIVGHIGGEGSLASFATMLTQHPDAANVLGGLLGGKEGESPLGNLGGLASGLFKS